MFFFCLAEKNVEGWRQKRKKKEDNLVLWHFFSCTEVTKEQKCHSLCVNCNVKTTTTTTKGNSFTIRVFFVFLFFHKIVVTVLFFSRHMRRCIWKEGKGGCTPAKSTLTCRMGMRIRLYSVMKCNTNNKWSLPLISCRKEKVLFLCLSVYISLSVCLCLSLRLIFCSMICIEMWYCMCPT